MLAILTLLAGCEPVSLTLFGVGAATGVNYALNGVAYKTFTAPVAEVRSASIKALDNMGIGVDSKTVSEDGEEVITAKTADREIEVVLEPISPKATRIRTSARHEGMLMDRATATEIIIQTERVLAGA